MDSTVPLVERKRRQARQRIVEAAEELFFSSGYEAVTVSEIAERAEVGRTTFFRHFSDKQEVVFAREQQLLATITAAGQDDDNRTPVRTMTEAVEQLCALVLTLCRQATADPDDYVRHYRLVEQHVELRARDALKMQEFAGNLGDLLIHRGADPIVAVSAAHVALGCYLTARSLGGDPRTLVADTQAAFERVLALGTEPPLD